ncbi:hypothetical protein K438DRAFT_1975117 [Mycena galopus ATCC 62051]|nr:hypothetical protein K438DRAFT_1975117 [Mycena galopus ATCC 62051]
MHVRAPYPPGCPHPIDLAILASRIAPVTVCRVSDILETPPPRTAEPNALLGARLVPRAPRHRTYPSRNPASSPLPAPFVAQARARAPR